MSLLSVNAINKSFGGLRALSNVTFTIEDDEVVGLMGANGAGKTTLFSIIAGHQSPDDGEINFDAHRISGLSADRVCRLGIARTFQIVRPFASLTVQDNVETALLFGSDNAKVALTPSQVSSRAMQILDEVDLTSQADKLAGALTLSGRKRLEVARALGTEPKLLLLDEVMAGLTPAEVVKMIDTVRSIVRDRKLSVIIIEHVVRALNELSSRMIVLHHGELIAQGDTHSVTQDPAVRAVYFGDEAS